MTFKCIRGQTAGKRGAQDKFPRLCSPAEGLGIAHEKMLAGLPSLGKGLQKHILPEVQTLLGGPAKKRCQSPRTVLLSRDLICIISLKTETDHALGGAETHGFR